MHGVLPMLILNLPHVLARPKAGLSFRVDEFGGGILVDGPMAAEG